MKKLNVTFKNTTDATGYLLSMVKCLSAALICGGYEDYAQDIVASGGFAFRMWVDPGLCPSATSIWELKKQREWVENGGLCCDYVERLWNAEEIEEIRRLEAIEIIRSSIDRGVAAVAWDISGCEWGLVIGYEDESQTLYTLKISGEESEVPYEKLGKLELPMLSVLAVTGKSGKSAADILAGTKKLALSHLRGEEWSENNTNGIQAYDLLVTIIDERLTADKAWNLEYYLGTYAALKWYAWKFFEKYGEEELAGIYRSVYTCWKGAFDAVKEHAGNILDADFRAGLSNALTQAKALEEKAMALFDQ